MPVEGTTSISHEVEPLGFAQLKLAVVVDATAVRVVGSKQRCTNFTSSIYQLFPALAAVG